MDQSRDEQVDYGSKSATLLSLIGTEIHTSNSTVINHEWTASSPKTAHDPTAAPVMSAPNHLTGLKPIVIVPHVEKTANWKRRITFKITIVTLLLLTCLTFGVIALRYSNRMVTTFTLSEEEHALSHGQDVNSTEDTNGNLEGIYDDSESSYSSWESPGESSSYVEDGIVELTDMLRTSGTIRLIGGNTPYEGRVEVKKQGRGWGTICHDWWGLNDGKVACQQLGFGRCITTTRNAVFGPGRGNIWFTKMNCNGNEASLQSCRKRKGNTNSCNHNKDAGVRCEAPESGASSACSSSPCVNGVCSNQNNGARFECTCNSGWTGTRCNVAILPCDSSPCANRATCRNNGANFACSCRPGWSGTRCTVAVLACDSSPCINGATCRNNGANFQCTCRTGWTGTRCNVAVRACDSRPCLNGATCININNGATYACTCSPGWTGTRCNTAVLACDSRPCLNGATCSNINNGANFECTCSPGWTGTRCDTAVLACDSSPCLNGATCSNRNNGANFECTCSLGWNGTRCDTIAVLACDSSPCLNDATCSNRNNGATYECTCSPRRYPRWNGTRCDILIDNCSPNPCQNGGLCKTTVKEAIGYKCTCTGNYDGVDCENDVSNDQIQDDQIRLVGGSGSFEGRIEVSHNGDWGTICHDSWDKADADVVCRMLGFAGAYEASLWAAYGEGASTSRIWLNKVNCAGNEDSLFDCRHGGWGNQDCSHRQDAGVSCLQDGVTIPDKTVRLVGGTAFAGRVEVWRNGVWGAICDDYWGMEEAEVVCKQLGYTAAVVSYNWQDSKYSQFGDLDGDIWLDDMQCFGTETRLEDCPHAGWANNNCVHDQPFSEQAGVMCYNPVLTATNDLLATGDCGNRPLVNDRIVGGQTVQDAWPWMASMRDAYNNHRCGASLISPNWAITAAHCDYVAHKLVLGDLKRNTESSNHQEALVTVFRNPNYDPNTIDNDFTLLKLNTPVQINNHVRPICLEVSSTEMTTYPDGKCKAVGWGDLEFEGSSSNNLKQVDLALISEAQCSSIYRHITENMICTDSPREAGTCQGDSGGPLQCVKDGKWNLVGVTSHGYECGNIGVPDVFARVSRFWQFVKQTVDMNGGP